MAEVRRPKKGGAAGGKGKVTFLYISLGKISKQAAATSKILQPVLGKVPPLDVDQKFVEDATFITESQDDQKGIITDVVVPNFNNCLTGADSLESLCKSDAGSKQKMADIKKILFVYDSNNGVSDSIGAPFVKVQVNDQSILEVTINMNSIDIFKDASWQFEAKVKAALLNPSKPQAKPEPVSAPTKQTPPPAKKATTPPPKVASPTAPKKVASSPKVAPAKVAPAKVATPPAPKKEATAPKKADTPAKAGAPPKAPELDSRGEPKVDVPTHAPDGRKYTLDERKELRQLLEVKAKGWLTCKRCEGKGCCLCDKGGGEPVMWPLTTKRFLLLSSLRKEMRMRFANETGRPTAKCWCGDVAMNGFDEIYSGCSGCGGRGWLSTDIYVVSGSYYSYQGLPSHAAFIKIEDEIERRKIRVHFKERGTIIQKTKAKGKILVEADEDYEAQAPGELSFWKYGLMEVDRLEGDYWVGGELIVSWSDDHHGTKGKVKASMVKECKGKS